MVILKLPDLLDLLEKTCMFGYRPTDSPIEANHCLSGDFGKPVDKERHPKTCGKTRMLFTY